jgi:hypothetical protein
MYGCRWVTRVHVTDSYRVSFPFGHLLGPPGKHRLHNHFHVRRRRQDQAIFASDSKKLAPSCKHEDFRL